MIENTIMAAVASGRKAAVFGMTFPDLKLVEVAAQVPNPTPPHPSSGRAPKSSERLGLRAWGGRGAGEV